ncbi:MAG: D-2-hydroxyacid dehydrogenase [Chloroflexi bacterium]|nr:D-2-hydroxyacid dehydrogenase [Chloroflexota bacterium]
MADILVLMTIAFQEELLERIKALSPRLKLVVDTVRSEEDFSEDLLAEVEVLYTASVLPDPEDTPNLKWVQVHFAGVDHLADHPLLQSEVRVTTLSGVAASGMTEFAVMMMLSLGRRLPLMMEDKSAKLWAEDRFERFKPVQLRGSTVGIVGYGSIGRQIARICRSFGAEVLATKRDLKKLEDPGFQFDDLGDADSSLLRRLYPPQALASMAAECDFLIITIPLTSETRGTVDEKIFERMKPSSFLIDLSRGGIVDHGALVDALRDKRIAGAALDVYPVEPLPESSPLWEMGNVILSPHVAGSSARYNEMAIELFAENMQRYLADQPLLNRFIAERGY